MKKLLAILVAILMIVTTIPMVALPASAALTPTATGGCNGNHSGYTQIKLNGGTLHRITKAGNYYINSSIYESTYSPALEIECSGTVTICFNGYDICQTGYGSRVVYLSANGGELTVNLCDCKGTGEIYHEKGDTGIDFAPGVITLNMYGGTIRDCNSGISTWRNSTVNMYGGTIKNCSYYGIYQYENSGIVNIYGGSIINNTEGIRVCSADSVTLTGSPVISGNTNGDLYYRLKDSAVIAKDLSVSSPITIGQDSKASGDYAVVKVDSADMLGSFKYINNTKQLFYNNNQIFVHGDSHSFKDATCTAPKTCTICGATEGVADNTAHTTWGEGVLTRPTKTKEGYYTYTCSACGATKTEAAERATNYAEYTEALNDLRAYLDSDKLTDDAKASVAEWLEIYDSDEAYKFIAGEEETVNLYIEAALYYATEIEAAIQDCLAGNHSGNGEYCDICGAALHICDFSGEWKYDSEKHWKECSCGVSNTASAHTYIDGACECGYKCSHEWVGVAFAKPTRTEEGYYTYTCSVCKSTKTEPVERPANYAEFKELIEKVKGYLDENLTDSMMQEVNNVINFFELDENHGFIKGEENFVSQMISQISGFVEVVEEGIADGTAVKVDGFTVYTERGREWLLKFADEGIFEKARELILNSTEVKAKLDEIYDFALSLEGNVAENAENIAKIEADIDEFFGQLKKCAYGIHNVSQYKEISPAKCGENAIESAVCTLCGETVTREVENSALRHSFTKYEETEAPKCGVEGKEVAYCDNGCGETDEKAIEALRHSFTKYEETEAPKCGIEGKEVAYCDNGCGETDEKAIEALTHTDADGDYICDNGCGYEFEKPAPEEPTPDTPDEPTEDDEICTDCGGSAHPDTGLPQYLCMIITFMKLIFSLVSVLQSIA